MCESPILAGEPFSAEKTQEIVDRFARDGYCHIPGVLTEGEITALRDRTDELMDDPEIQTRFDPNLGDSRYIEVRAHATTGEELPFILRNCIELDQMYRDMLVREPIFSLAEAIVGKNSKFCGENVIRNVPGLAIEFWHSDGDVWFPLPDSIARHDPKARMPALWFTVQVALTDIETVEQGPTQYVPASHYSGRPVDRFRPPEDPKRNKDALVFDVDEEPEFDGNGPVSMLSKAGDIYLQHPMTWHRGAPNTSDRTRYLFQAQYAANWAYLRFNLFNRVPVPEDALRTSSDKLLNLLGRPRPD